MVPLSVLEKRKLNSVVMRLHGISFAQSEQVRYGWPDLWREAHTLNCDPVVVAYSVSVVDRFSLGVACAARDCSATG